MKLSRIVLGAVAASLLIAGGAFAQDEVKGKLRLPETVNIEGKAVPAGDYKVTFSGTGPNVELKLVKGKETVATVTAQLVPIATTNSVDSYGIRQEADGKRTLTAIYLSGKKYNLDIVSAQVEKPAVTSGASR